ncbi:MAG: hypothetical protein H7Y03_12285, partial [Chitinophagaceae bacterium]|nr:hypothetical protein [Chitinophagaceae bacterium]
MKLFSILLPIIISATGYAQHDSIPVSKATIDTAAVLDSMMADLALLKELMQEKSSYFNINLNYGNQLFSNNNFSLNSQQTTSNIAGLKPGIGYYHKSGLSISGIAYMNISNRKDGFYQYSITPAYDFALGKKVAGGFSYTHYLTMAKDTIPDFATPYDDEFYGYIFMTSGAIQPGITLGYAMGKYTSVFRGKVQGPFGNPVYVIDSQRSKQADFSISASVQHDFSWSHIFTKKDDLSFTPTLML